MLNILRKRAFACGGKACGKGHGVFLGYSNVKKALGKLFLERSKSRTFSHSG